MAIGINIHLILDGMSSLLNTYKICWIIKGDTVSSKACNTAKVTILLK